MKSTSTGQSKKVAKILFEIGAVSFSRNRPFRFDSGLLSPVYVDNRILISYPKERKLVIAELFKIIKDEVSRFDVVAGVATAGIPHAAWIADKLNKPMIFVRSKPKDHGKGQQVEGKLSRGQRVLVIEDLISTARSSKRVVEAIRAQGGVVSDEIAIYSHNLKEADKNMNKVKVKLHNLTDTKTAALYAKEKGFLKKEQTEIIFDWVKDPQNWAKKMGIE